ncbi:MAG: bifunctional riboflavin kinase/FAD synthetase [Deltaproteobacteria bacterium]|nr:bifunctional riboflavin kinase/FAD synthetase [Deltaproteobacteria bacterium]
MKRFKDADEYPADEGCVLSIGNFDGFHLGHRKVVGVCLEKSRALGIASTVLTFEPHPLEVLSPDRAPRRIATPEVRAELLEEFGLDRLVEHPFSTDLASLSAEEFVDRFVMGAFKARCVVVGRGFRFGRKRSGDEDVLRKLGQERGYEVIVVEEADLDGEVISSSRVRLLLARDADVSGAARLLGRPHRVHGVIVRGRGRGRSLGFPTANLEQVPELIPARGIYACMSHMGASARPAAVHVGPRLTFDDESTVEAYIVGQDHDQDLYDELLRLDFLEMIREPKKFDDKDDLVEQIRMDVDRTVEIVQGYGKEEA